MSKAVFYICDNKEWGHVSYRVWDILKEEGYLNEKTDVIFDGRQTYRYRDGSDNEYWFVPTRVAVCLDYPRWLPEMNKYFSDFDISGMVTWHEGGSAPSNILTVHSHGDVVTGIYAHARPRLMRNLLTGIDREREALGLDEYRVVTEATHWSGVFDEHGLPNDPAMLLEYPVSMMDIEVGSDPSSWENNEACRALARGIFHVFDDDGLKVHNLLCVGGIHFQPDWAEAPFRVWDGQTFGVTHAVANQWLVDGKYEEGHGLEWLEKCMKSIEGGVDAIVFHDKMKACYKDLCRQLGEKYDIPIFKHQRLRTPETMGLR